MHQNFDLLKLIFVCIGRRVMDKILPRTKVTKIWVVTVVLCILLRFDNKTMKPFMCKRALNIKVTLYGYAYSRSKCPRKSKPCICFFLCVIILLSSLFTSSKKTIKGYSESKGIGGHGPHFFYMGYNSGN